MRVVFVICCLTIVSLTSQAQSTSYTPINDTTELGVRISLDIWNNTYSSYGLYYGKFINAKIKWRGFWPKERYLYLCTFFPGVKAHDKIYGFQIGYEYIYYGLYTGLETKYVTDYKISDFVITPKIGFGLPMSKVSFGFNIGVNNFKDKYPIYQITWSIGLRIFKLKK